MKKLLIIMTLFMSSFFFLCNKEVKAAVNLSHEMDFTIFETSDTFFRLKSEIENILALDNGTSYSDLYLITYESGKFYGYIFSSSYNYSPVAIFNSALDSLYVRVSSYASDRLATRYYFDSSDNLVSKTSYQTGNINVFYVVYSSRTINYSIRDVNSSNTSNIKDSIINHYYNDYEVVDTIESSASVYSTTYDLYLKYKEEVGEIINKHIEELGKVESFYTVVIQKLTYLAEIIVSNYIYLSIIVIFILIFVFLLIFRRFIC